jgi:hypothetical protein
MHAVYFTDIAGRSVVVTIMRFVLLLQIEFGRGLPSGLYNATQYHGIILMLWKHTTSLLRRFLSKSG